LHFSCGFEVKSFDWDHRSATVALKNDYKKKGSVFVYLPESKGLDNVVINVNGKPGRADIVAKPSLGESYHGRVLRVYTEIKGSGVKHDGLVSMSW